MHCTWFNGEKKKVNFPYNFLWVVSSPKHIPTSVALIVPACPSHHHLGKERHAHPSPPEGTSPGTLGPGPAGLQLLTSPGACAPQFHSAHNPTVLDRPKRRTRPGRDPLSLALSSDPV